MTHTPHVHSTSVLQVIEWWPNCLSSQLTLGAVGKSEGGVEKWVSSERDKMKGTVWYIGFLSDGHSGIPRSYEGLNDTYWVDSQPLIKAASTVQVVREDVAKDKRWRWYGTRFNTCIDCKGKSYLKSSTSTGRSECRFSYKTTAYAEAKRVKASEHCRFLLWVLEPWYTVTTQYWSSM